MAMRVFTFLATLLAIYVAGFLLFVITLPQRPDAPLKADGIVALTGGGERLDAAVALFEGGTGKRLLISGVNKESSRDEIKRINGGGRRFDCCADIGYAAEDTYGNAEEAAAWVKKHRIASVILVTASYHMPRSLRLFRTLMPNTRFIAYPVEPAGVNLAQWWHPGTLHLLHNEYLKYVASYVMTAVDQKGAGGKA